MTEADEKTCPACAETIKAAAVKCRYCGEAQPATEVQLEQVEAPQLQTGKALGGGAAGAATGGCLAAGLGMWVGAAMCALGGLACLTGIGSIIGAPMIIGGIMCPVIGGLMGGAAGGAVGVGAGAAHGLTPEQLEAIKREGYAKPGMGGLNQPIQAPAIPPVFRVPLALLAIAGFIILCLKLYEITKPI